MKQLRQRSCVSGDGIPKTNRFRGDETFLLDQVFEDADLFGFCILDSRHLVRLVTVNEAVEAEKSDSDSEGNSKFPTSNRPRAPTRLRFSFLRPISVVLPSVLKYKKRNSHALVVLFANYLTIFPLTPSNVKTMRRHGRITCLADFDMAMDEWSSNHPALRARHWSCLLGLRIHSALSPRKSTSHCSTCPTTCGFSTSC
jgi:hypothetical protein